MADTSDVERGLREFARDRAERLGERFVEVAQGFVPRRTGALHDSIELTDVREGPSGFTAHVTVGEEYGAYQNFGTGIYGPNGHPITPKHGNVLVFDSLFGGGIVFARSVRGTEPTHFWERTLDAWPSIVGSA